jgi:hypothetical protein
LLDMTLGGLYWTCFCPLLQLGKIHILTAASFINHFKFSNKTAFGWRRTDFFRYCRVRNLRDDTERKNT